MQFYFLLFTDLVNIYFIYLFIYLQSGTYLQCTRGIPKMRRITPFTGKACFMCLWTKQRSTPQLRACLQQNFPGTVSNAVNYMIAGDTKHNLLRLR